MSGHGSFKGGLDLKFFPDSQFESLEHVESKERIGILARNNLRLLMMGWSESASQLITWETFCAFFIKDNIEFAKEFRAGFQQGFESIYEQIKDLKLNNEQSEQYQIYLSNCLSHLPYAYLTPFETIKIPQCIDGQWELVEYYINPIELTDESKLTAKKHDRVFAYGLEPVINQKATPHLIFMGTTFPARPGFFSQIEANFHAFATLGTPLYLSGRSRVHHWLASQKNKVHVCGGSLGASLALLLAVDKGEDLLRVDAFNPAGMYQLKSNGRYDRWNKMHSKPQVVVQQEGDDLLSQLGFWKPDWTILHVSPPQDKKGPNFLFDHFMNYAGFADTVFTYADPEQQNADRYMRNLLVYSVGRSVIDYLMIRPYAMIVRPVFYFVIENKILSLLAVTGVLLGLMVAEVLSPFVFFTATSLFGILTGLSFILEQSTESTESMISDIQKNKIEVTFTEQELYDYHAVMTELVEEHDIQNYESRDGVVTLNISRAKAMHIRHGLTFIDKLSLENRAELKKALSYDYEHYSSFSPDKF